MSVCGIYVLFLLGFYFGQRHIIFQPEPLPKDYRYQFNHPFEEYTLYTPDNTAINALLFKTNVQSKCGVVLYLHGNADNLQRWGNYHVDFTRRGYDVFFIEYRGYGKSEGMVSEEHLYEDAQIGYDWIKQRYDTGDIIIYGRSLGCAPASKLGALVSAKMLILETPFNNIKGTLENRAMVLYLPYNLDYNLPNDKHIPLVNCPIYIFHGTDDMVVPYASAQELEPLLKKGDRFITIPEGGHKNLSDFEEYQRNLDLILDDPDCNKLK